MILNVSGEGGVASRYHKLEVERSAALERAREASRYTIPHLVPEAGHSDATAHFQAWQSVGASGVNHLAAKLLLALFPPNRPFFRYSLSEAAMARLASSPEARQEAEMALGRFERIVMTEFEARRCRTALAEVLRQLVVAGNVLLHVPHKGAPRVFKLDSYVVRRDPVGTPLEIITRERVSWETLPSDVREAIPKPTADADPKNAGFHRVDLYTRVYLENGLYRVYQEVGNTKVPGSEGSYTPEDLPWLPLRWTRNDNEHYGRSYVEELIGDLRAVDALSQALAEGHLAMAKIIILVNPNGLTDPKVLEARSLSVRAGRAEDVSVVQMPKAMDFSVAREHLLMIERRLERAFLLHTAVQRNAERVTAEEIRFMAQELEDALGGVYSLLSAELQLPIVNILTAHLRREKVLPALPKSQVRPVVIAGLEALGRGHDLTRLDTFIAGIGELLGPQAIPTFINVPGYITRRATALGIETEGLVKTEEQVMQEQAAMQLAAMGQQVAPEAVKQLLKDAPQE